MGYRMVQKVTFMVDIRESVHVVCCSQVFVARQLDMSNIPGA